MTQGPEPTPRTVFASYRAPQAWQNLLKVQFEQIPRNVTASRRSRAALRQVWKVPGRHA